MASANGRENREPLTSGPTQGPASTLLERSDMSSTSSSASSNDDVAELRREITRLSGLVSDMAQSRYAKVKDQAAGVAQEVVDRGSEIGEEAYRRASAMEREVERSIRDRPLTAVALAATAGYLLGLFSRR